MDPEKLRAALLRGLAVVEVIARLTPNKFDDVTVAALKAILADDETLSKLAELLMVRGVKLPPL